MPATDVGVVHTVLTSVVDYTLQI